jgi:small GTP-binding protein
MQDYLRVVVTGEVDSGKSTLIGRLLYETGSLSEGALEEIKNVCQRLGNDFEFAYLLDSFEEERKGQLTIDTTQVFCRAKKGRQLIFIDVPGHQELLKNMLCGSSYADIAVLVVDASKSIEEQTRRHFFILKFLGIRQVILALSKMDLTGFSEDVFKDVQQRIIEFSKKLEIKLEHFVPLSAKQGENIIKKSKKMPWYKGLSLLGTLSGCSKERINDDFRLPIQDIYEFNGEKIAVGEIISGEIRNRERVSVLPSNKKFMVKRIKVFNKNKSYARAPESIGLVLNNMEALSRGQVICKTALPKIEQEITAKIFCINPLNINGNFTFKCTTQEALARVKHIDKTWDTATLEEKSSLNLLDRADVAQVILALDRPVTVESYTGSNSLGRFVLKSNDEIYAVGIIP